MVLAHDLQHRGAHDPRDIADPGDADGEGGQDQMLDLLARIPRPRRWRAASRSQTAKISTRVKRHDEGGDRDRADREDARSACRARCCGGSPNSSPAGCRSRRPRGSRPRSGSACRAAARTRCRDTERPVKTSTAHVAAQEVAEKGQHLHGKRLVEAHRRPRLLDQLGRRPRAKDHHRRIARHQVHHHVQQRDRDR